MTASSFLLTLLLVSNVSKPATPVVSASPVSSPTSRATSAELDKLAKARPNDLKVHLEVLEPGHISITAKFHLRTSGAPGELRVDLWNHGDEPVAETRFSVRNTTHLTARQAYGTAHRQMWMSSTMEAELKRDSPELMRVYWAVLTDHQLYEAIDAWLGTLPPDPLAGNPACGVTKWGLKILIWIAGAGCCAASGGSACIACTVGSSAGTDIVNDSINCGNECNPKCPIS